MKDFIQNELRTEYGIFTSLSIINGSFLGNLGKPQLPVITCIFAVTTLNVSLNIITSHISETNLVGKVFPSQQPEIDSDEDGISNFFIDEEFYQQDTMYPGKLTEIVDKGKIRDISFIKIEFYPIQYNPKKGFVTVYDEINIELSWDAGEIVYVEPDFNNAIFLSFYENVFPNWQGYLGHTHIIESTNNLINEGCNYLIISHPDFYNEISKLADWKNSKGIITKVVDTSETGTQTNEIKLFIKNAYYNYNIRPSYILLVGDSEYIPTNLVSGMGTDLYYTTVDGSDYYPDIYIGRIPVDSPQETKIVVQKILTYEQTPPDSPIFYNNFAVAAYFQDDDSNGYEDRRFVKTSEEIRDFLLLNEYEGERIYYTYPYINPTHYNQGTYSNGEPLPDELLRPTFAWDGNTNDITNVIEQGVFLICHRDHGLEDGWDQPTFLSDNINELSNGELLPVVFSINCLTGTFYNYDCFCEKFITKEGGGCVGIFGASDVSYSGYNDYLVRGMFDSMWPNFDTEEGTDSPMYTLGEMLNYGKMYMTYTWGDPWGYQKLTFELFHCFGDPTMEIWSAYPTELDVNYSFQDDTLEVRVKDFGIPIKNALVCLRQESGYYLKGFTDDDGTIKIDTSLANYEEEIILVLSSHNYYTYQQIFYLNQIPSIPSKPSGLSSPKAGQLATYTTYTTDPEGDNVFFKWNWGDGNETIWLGPYNSDEEAKSNWIWTQSGNYVVKVKAKDELGRETNWSEPLQITVTKSKSLKNIRFQFLFEMFPNINRLLKGLFNF